MNTTSPSIFQIFNKCFYERSRDYLYPGIDSVLMTVLVFIALYTRVLPQEIWPKLCLGFISVFCCQLPVEFVVPVRFQGLPVEPLNLIPKSGHKSIEGVSDNDEVLDGGLFVLRQEAVQLGRASELLTHTFDPFQRLVGAGKPFFQVDLFSLKSTEQQ